MTPERFRQIRNLYEAVLEKAPDEQRQFLGYAGQGDADLLREVEQLLIARERTAEVIGQPLFERIELDPAGHAMPRMEGRLLGNYRILREIGRGGMGTVYLASRADGSVHQQVAVKVMRDPQDSEILRRFRQERDILASLDHPSIARLIDAASTEEGLPYFVMDYVDGEPIDVWCNRHKLGVTERLRLFRAVCDAVQYAHQRKVVHRDLKPANILVTSAGVVKLLDFGIAKLLQEVSPTVLPPTETLPGMMTLEYASPEQVCGGAIDTASDIYALGIVLYLLLTGRSPYRLKSRVLHELARVICEEEPTRPSSVIEEDGDTAGSGPVENPGRLRHLLVGDLDNILLKALQKQPARRYPSADQFSEDLRKHLDGLPVSARQDTLWYRAGKFAWRHRVGVAASLLIAASLLLGLGATLWQTGIALQHLKELPSLRNAGAIPIPELILYNFIAWVAFGAVVYFARANTRRLAGALAGGVVLSFLTMEGTALADSMGLARYKWELRPSLLGWSALALSGAALALIGWRLNRAFGRRGLIGFLVAIAVYGPAHDFIDASMMQIISPVSSIRPWVADSILWIATMAVALGVMRLVSGPPSAGLRDAIR